MIRTHVRPINGRDIPIGRKGETMARDIDFTDIINEIKNDYGDGGKAVVLVCRSGEDVSYPAACVDESEGLIWTPTSTDTAVAGRGSVEVDYYIDDALIKSVMFDTRVDDSLAVTGDTPEPGYDYMKQVLEGLEKVGTGIVEVKQNEDSSVTFVMSDGTEYTTEPLKGADGEAGESGADGVSPTVATEDIEGGTRVTITDASGAHTFDVMDGISGGEASAPTIGENGNWYINGNDTGKPSRGENGADGKDGTPGKDGAPGADGEDGADGFSPTVQVEESEGGHTVTITDKAGAHSFTVHDGADGADGAPGKDGAPGEKGDPGQDGAPGTPGKDGTPGADGQDGADGVSPTVATENIAGGTRVTITDKDGAHAFDVMNGKDGGEAATPVIGENGNWYVNGVDTGKPSRGEAGADGAPGKDGAPGEKGDPGTPGADGAPGRDGNDGAPGKDGENGQDGADGFSPTVQVEESEGEHTVTITDNTGAHSFTVRDGVDGQDGADGAPGKDGAPGADGVSPTVETGYAVGGTKVTITDKDGAHEFTVKDGKAGSAGARGLGVYVATKEPTLSYGTTYEFDAGTIQPTLNNAKAPYYGDTVISPDGILYNLSSTANNRLAVRYEDADGNPISIKGADGGAGGSSVHFTGTVPMNMGMGQQYVPNSDIFPAFEADALSGYVLCTANNSLWTLMGMNGEDAVLTMVIPGQGGSVAPQTLNITGMDIYQLFKSSTFTLAFDDTTEMKVIWGMIGDEKVSNIKATLNYKSGEFHISFDILCDMGNATEPMYVGCKYIKDEASWRYMRNNFTEVYGLVNIVSADAMRLNGGIIDSMHVQKATETGAEVIGVFREVVKCVNPYNTEEKPVYDVCLNLENMTLNKVSMGDTVRVVIKGHVPVFEVADI